MYRRATMLVAVVIAAMGIMPAQAASAAASQQSTPAATAAQVVVFGTVVEGVESGCVMLRSLTGSVLYNITGSAVALPPAGTTVIATGEPRPDWISFCQQGTPFEVTSIRRILVSTP